MRLELESLKTRMSPEQSGVLLPLPGPQLHRRRGGELWVGARGLTVRDGPVIASLAGDAQGHVSHTHPSFGNLQVTHDITAGPRGEGSGAFRGRSRLGPRTVSRSPDRLPGSGLSVMERSEEYPFHIRKHCKYTLKIRTRVY